MVLIQNCANDVWMSHTVHCHTFHEIRRPRREGCVAMYGALASDFICSVKASNKNAHTHHTTREMQQQPPVLSSTKVHTNQMLNNITQAQSDSELERITQGSARPGFFEYNGKFMYTNATRGWREVLPVEDRERLLEGLHKVYGYPDLQRFHSLVERQYAGVSRRKLARWYNDSANNQIHARMQSKTIVSVRPVYAHDPARHLQCGLVDY